MAWRHIDSWQAAAADLDLSVSGPVNVTVASGVITAELLVMGFGGAKGMVVSTDYETIEPHRTALLASGYGYSVFDPPNEGEQVPTEDVIELLRDWTWTGPPKNKPAWLSRP